MKRHAFGVLALLLLACHGWAAPPSLKIDAEIKPAGQYATFTPSGDCVAVVYVGLSGVDPIPSAVLKDGRMFLLDTRGLAVGRYKFAAVGAGKEGEQARADFVVVVGDVPPGPEPGPGPNPPKPPDDPLFGALQAAYGSDTDADKAKYRDGLAALYRQAAKMIAERQDVTTWGKLYDVMAEAAKSLGVSGKLTPVQQVLQGELKKLLPADGTKQLDAAGRESGARAFVRAATLLEALR